MQILKPIFFGGCFLINLFCWETIVYEYLTFLQSQILLSKGHWQTLLKDDVSKSAWDPTDGVLLLRYLET